MENFKWGNTKHLIVTFLSAEGKKVKAFQKWTALRLFELYSVFLKLGF